MTSNILLLISVRLLSLSIWITPWHHKTKPFPVNYSTVTFLQELLIDDSKEEQDDGIKLTSLKHLDNKGYEEDDTGSGWLLTNDNIMQLSIIFM